MTGPGVWWRVVGGLLVVITVLCFSPDILFDDIQYASHQQRSIAHAIMWTALPVGITCFVIGVTKRHKGNDIPE